MRRAVLTLALRYERHSERNEPRRPLNLRGSNRRQGRVFDYARPANSVRLLQMRLGIGVPIFDVY